LWHLESEYDGIQIFSARVLGTKIVPFKAVAEVPASIEEISAVLEDESRRSEWVARLGESVLLERLSDYEQTNYVRMRLPWPLTDRTALVRVSIDVAEGGHVVTIAGRSTRCCVHPALPELVRAEVFESTFQMARLRFGTRVTALVFVDPGGNLPAWVVNLFTGYEARRTLTGLRRQVDRRLYSPAAIAEYRRRWQEFPNKSQ
jgi:hypothetical protein